MRHSLLALGVVALAIAACEPGAARSPSLPDPASPTAGRILVVTPTDAPTRVPTAMRAAPTTAATLTPAAAGERCDQVLDRLYASAGDLCLGAPTGFFCNGGGAPAVEPQSEAFNSPGDKVPAERIVSLGTAPLGTRGGGGLVWLRLEDKIRMNALLIGELELRNQVPAASEFANWQSLTIESGGRETGCDNAPPFGALALQSVYGRSSRLAINGASLQIDGTVIALTQADMTKFIAIEGQIGLVVMGQSVTLKVGEQLNLRYADGDFSKPVAIPAGAQLLEYDLIKHLPIFLFDRPVAIPQPGYAQTQGGVNMRAEPDINARLLYLVPAGETMSVLGISSDGDWLHIRLGNGETGWMSAGLLARNLGEISAVYDITPRPPQRYGELATRAIVDVAAGGNLRQAPDTAFAIKRTLPYGMSLTLLARSPYSPWVKVDTGRETGWMALFTLRSQSVISSLPIDYTVPLPPRATATPSFSYGGGHAYPDPGSGY